MTLPRDIGHALGLLHPGTERELTDEWIEKAVGSYSSRSSNVRRAVKARDGSAALAALPRDAAGSRYGASWPDQEALAYALAGPDGAAVAAWKTDLDSAVEALRRLSQVKGPPCGHSDCVRSPELARACASAPTPKKKDTP
jgi:hypothetical protein